MAKSSIISKLEHQYSLALKKSIEASERAEEASRRLKDALVKEADARFAARGIEPGTCVVGDCARRPGKTLRGIFIKHETAFLTSEPKAFPVVMKMRRNKTASDIRAKGSNWRKMPTKRRRHA